VGEVLVGTWIGAGEREKAGATMATMPSPRGKTPTRIGAEMPGETGETGETGEMGETTEGATARETEIGTGTVTGAGTIGEGVIGEGMTEEGMIEEEGMTEEGTTGEGMIEKEGTSVIITAGTGIGIAGGKKNGNRVALSNLA
jgi:hypothetical protein